MNRPSLDHESGYSARVAYLDPEVGRTYEADRFSSAAGRYRLDRETRTIGQMLSRVPAGARMLDCPCGTGRWWPLLHSRGASVVGADLSPAMLDHARARARETPTTVELLEADAEALPLDEGSFDVVFSYALTKHLPRITQYKVLAEFGRVARSAVLCSFPVFSHLSYEVWRRRYRGWRNAGLDESILLLPEELDSMAAAAGLRVAERRRCTTPLGTEWMVWFER